MALLVDTNAVPPNERFEYWRAASSKTIMPFRIRSSKQQPFCGRISGYSLGPVRVFRIESDPSVVLRTQAGILASDPECMQIAVHLRGATTISQGDRATTLTRGDIACLDSSRPYAIDNVAPVEWLVFAIPRLLLRPNLDQICRQTAMRIPRNEGLARLASPFLCRLGDGLGNGSILGDDADIGASVLALIRGLYAERGVSGAVKPTRQAVLLLRIKQFMETNLGDANLCPEQIAQAHFISIRQLNRLFESEGMSVCEWIRWQRLERCRQEIGDPGLADERVLTIAARWGFRSQAHFSRLFRATYGYSPREYRRECLAGSTTSRPLATALFSAAPEVSRT